MRSLQYTKKRWKPYRPFHREWRPLRDETLFTLMREAPWKTRSQTSEQQITSSKQHVVSVIRKNVYATLCCRLLHCPTITSHYISYPDPTMPLAFILTTNQTFRSDQTCTGSWLLFATLTERRPCPWTNSESGRLTLACCCRRLSSSSPLRDFLPNST